MNHTICIIGALKDEISGVRERMEIHETLSTETVTAFLGIWHQKRILLVRSGIGCHRAQSVLETVCSRYSVSEILSIGFAGGLALGLSLGDLVIADTIREVRTITEPTAWGEADLLPVDGLWVEKALKLSFPEALTRRRGGLVTINQPVCKPSEKMRLGKDYTALAVDMESSVLLRTAIKKEIPFLSVRAILDTVEQELIDFSNCIDPSGEVSKVKVGWHILTHPGLIPQVEILRKGAQTATKNLTRFLDEWVRHLP